MGEPSPPPLYTKSKVFTLCLFCVSQTGGIDYMGHIRISGLYG